MKVLTSYHFRAIKIPITEIHFVDYWKNKIRSKYLFKIYEHTQGDIYNGIRSNFYRRK